MLPCVLSLSQTCILPLQFVDTCWNSNEGFRHLLGDNAGCTLAGVSVVSYEMTAQCCNLTASTLPLAQRDVGK